MTQEELMARLRSTGQQYRAGQFARGGTPEKHMLEVAADLIEELRLQLVDCKTDYDYIQTIHKPDSGFVPWLRNRSTVCVSILEKRV